MSPQSLATYLFEFLDLALLEHGKDITGGTLRAFLGLFPSTIQSEHQWSNCGPTGRLDDSPGQLTMLNVEGEMSRTAET